LLSIDYNNDAKKLAQGMAPQYLQISSKKRNRRHAMTRLIPAVLRHIPPSMEVQWQKHEAACRREPFNLASPYPACPGCNTPIKPFYQNNSVISLSFFKGQMRKM